MKPRSLARSVLVACLALPCALGPMFAATKASSAGSSWKGSDVSRDLNREASSRYTGSQRSSSWSSATRSGGGYSRGGGGSMRGGGGGGRRR